MAISRPFAATIGSPHDIVRTLHRESVRTSHIPAYCMSIRRRPCSRKHTADMLMYRSTFVPSRHVACLLACLLAGLPHSLVTPSHRLSSELSLVSPLKQPTRTDSGTNRVAKTPSEFLFVISLQPRSREVLSRPSHYNIPEDGRFCPVHTARSCHLGHIET